jgi:probable rRNA maturation factor
MIHIEIADGLLIPIDPQVELYQLLARAAQTTLTEADMLDEADLAIFISDDVQLHELNRKFMGVDAATDVLSFPSDAIDPDTGGRYIGDVIISYPRAAAQADSSGHPLQEELQLLVVHGVLHLIGYDHADLSQKEVMWSIQGTILKKLGCSVVAP